jgi:hypothetical protein
MSRDVCFAAADRSYEVLQSLVGAALPAKAAPRYA